MAGDESALHSSAGPRYRGPMGTQRKIKGSTVVITGASSGIGRAAALRFAKEGADVVLASRRQDALNEVARECRSHKVRALAVPADVTDDAEVGQLARRAVEAFGKIDIWINNAGVSVFGPFLETPLKDFRRVLDVDIMGYVHGARAALKQMRQQRQGVLINVSSVVGEIAQPYTASYSVSKAGVNALSVSLRQELALEKLRNIHVVTVMPPAVDTPFFDNAGNYTGRKVQPLPPLYTPERVASALVSAVKRPRHEIPVGAAAKQLIRQHRMTPAPVEAAMGQQTERKHLSRKRTAPRRSGTLHEPGSADSTAVSGGWGGRRRQTLRWAATGGAVAGGTAVAAVAVPVALAGAKAMATYVAVKTAKSAAKKTRRRFLPGRKANR